MRAPIARRHPAPKRCPGGDGDEVHSQAMPKHSSHILELARKGAEQRYAELKAEIAVLVRQFPHLRASGRRTTIDMSSEPAAMIDRPRRRRRRKLSAAARRKISLAQKRRWAKQKGGGKHS